MGTNGGQQGGDHVGATGAEFVANNRVGTLPGEGSGWRGEWDVLRNKRQWCHGAGRSCCAMTGSPGSSRLAGSQLLRSSSVAVSTSQDFEDKAAITAF